jgi:hypothetical protein
MAHLYRTQVVLHRKSLIPADNVTNTMHFDADGDIEPEHDWEHWAAGLHDRVETFYETIAGLLSYTLQGTGVVTSYDMHDAEPRIPKFQTDLTFTPNGSNGYPGEVALCVSFRAAAGSGLNMARRRGRIFLGPMGIGMSERVGDNGEVRPTAAGRQTILDAFHTMADGISGAARLAIYSPTTDVTASIEDSFHDAVFAWIDDAFDTVRSRGASPTSRVTDVLG